MKNVKEFKSVDEYETYRDDKSKKILSAKELKKEELNTSFSAAFSSRIETIVGGTLVRASAFRVGLGVSGATIVSGSCACPS